MEVLWWLVVPLAVTALAGLVVSWAARPPREREHDDDERRERFAAAVAKPLPDRARRVVPQAAERPSGVAIRSTRRTASRG